MKIEFLFNGDKYVSDLENPLDISISLKKGYDNPNCYWADPPEFETIVSGDFIGSVAEGGPVNYQRLSITPHGNGTHTECYGHISSDGFAINQALQSFHFISELISVPPVRAGSDLIITKEALSDKISFNNTGGIIIRTLPNNTEKLRRKYSGTNPAYFEAAGLEMLAENNVNHLLVDLPSVDKEKDGGKLSAHRSFWKFPEATRKSSTITELIYVPDHIPDGLYLVNLQIISLEADACPSKPLLYGMSKS